MSSLPIAPCHADNACSIVNSTPFGTAPLLIAPPDPCGVGGTLPTAETTVDEGGGAWGVCGGPAVAAGPEGDRGTVAGCLGARWKASYTRSC